MIARTPRHAIAAALTVALLSACPPPKPAANAQTGAAGTGSSSKQILRLAGVEHFDIVKLETEPVQLRVVVYGWMSDPCTTIRNFEQTREGNLIYLRIITTRPADVMCAQMISKFRETYPLETKDLPPGTYTLDVSGKTQDFTLP